ncbi:hypothetical protein ES703_109775 [subsurface metagenome]
MPTPEQLEEIREHVKVSEERLKSWDEELTLAERAGIVDPSRRERYKDLKAKITKIKLVYKV